LAFDLWLLAPEDRTVLVDNFNKKYKCEKEYVERPTIVNGLDFVGHEYSPYDLFYELDI
jgi:hypothetical protein